MPVQGIDLMRNSKATVDRISNCCDYWLCGLECTKRGLAVRFTSQIVNEFIKIPESGALARSYTLTRIPYLENHGSSELSIVPRIV
jgi:hypothetical protein